MWARLNNYMVYKFLDVSRVVYKAVGRFALRLVHLQWGTSARNVVRDIGLEADKADQT